MELGHMKVIYKDPVGVDSALKEVDVKANRSDSYPIKDLGQVGLKPGLFSFTLPDIADGEIIFQISNIEDKLIFKAKGEIKEIDNEYHLSNWKEIDSEESLSWFTSVKTFFRELNILIVGSSISNMVNIDKILEYSQISSLLPRLSFKKRALDFSILELIAFIQKDTPNKEILGDKLDDLQSDYASTYITLKTIDCLVEESYKSSKFEASLINENVESPSSLVLSLIDQFFYKKGHSSEEFILTARVEYIQSSCLFQDLYFTGFDSCEEYSNECKRFAKELERAKSLLPEKNDTERSLKYEEYVESKNEEPSMQMRNLNKYLEYLKLFFELKIKQAHFGFIEYLRKTNFFARLNESKEITLKNLDHLAESATTRMRVYFKIILNLECLSSNIPGDHLKDLMEDEKFKSLTLSYILKELNKFRTFLRNNLDREELTVRKLRIEPLKGILKSCEECLSSWRRIKRDYETNSTIIEMINEEDFETSEENNSKKDSPEPSKAPPGKKSKNHRLLVIILVSMVVTFVCGVAVLYKLGN